MGSQTLCTLVDLVNEGNNVSPLQSAHAGDIPKNSTVNDTPMQEAPSHHYSQKSHFDDGHSLELDSHHRESSKRRKKRSDGASGCKSRTFSNGTSDQGTIDYDTLLEPWTEPQRAGCMHISGNQIVEFRQAFAIMTKPLFLSSAFGPVETRDECRKGSDRLVCRVLRILGDTSSPDLIDLEKLTHLMYRE